MLRYRLRELVGRWEVEHGEALPLEHLALLTGVSRPVLAKMADPKGYVTSTRHIEELCHFFMVRADELIVFDCVIGTPKNNRPEFHTPTTKEEQE